MLTLQKVTNSTYSMHIIEIQIMYAALEISANMNQK